MSGLLNRPAKGRAHHGWAVCAMVFLLVAAPGVAAAESARPLGVTAQPSSVIDPDLAARLSQMSPADTVAVFARLPTHADFSGVRERDHRRRTGQVVTALRSHADSRQRALLAALTSARAAHTVSTVQAWWIDNAVSFTGTAAAVRAVAARPDIASIGLDQAQIQPSNVPNRIGAAVAGGLRRSTVLPMSAPSGPPAGNLAQIGAPTLWARGVTGTSVVVADLDTGVDGTQPDLSGSWRSVDGWFDPYGQHTVPTDVNGHGTWTTSVMVGRDTGGQAVGVAPDARWIAARVFDDSGRATLSAVHAAFQWALNPSGNAAAPDPPNVLNASWSSASTACSAEFQPDLAALRAAGIVPVFAAGNSGPGAGSGTSPATLPEALSVGSVDSTDLVDVSSSRGPASCAGRTHFPDLMAPGVNIPVDDLFGGYWTASGTSLAAPHVAGALALLLSAHPGLTADQQQTAVLSTAKDLGASGPDDIYGFGRVDIVAAAASLGAVPPPGPVASAVTVTPNPVGGSDSPTVSASLSAAAGGTAPVSAQVSVDSAAPTPLTVTIAGGSYTAAGVLTGPMIDGRHTAAVSAADAAGVWGAPVSATFVVDRTSPTLTSVAVTPSPTAGAATVTVTANTTDTGTGVTFAEAWADADPGIGRGVAATLTPGTGGSATVRGDLPVGTLTAGTHTVSVRTRDAASNISVASGPLTISAAPPPGFADGFETGSLSAWSSSKGSGLAVSATAALSGRYGLAVTATRGGGSVRATVPLTSGPVGVRVLFDPRGLTTGSALAPIVVAGSASGSLWTIQYRKVTVGAQVRLSAVTSAGSQQVSAWVVIPSTGTTVVEVDTQPASGLATFYTADTARGTLTGLKSTTPVSLDVGLVGALPGSVSGTIRLDAVAINGTGHIGTNTAGL